MSDTATLEAPEGFGTPDADANPRTGGLVCPECGRHFKQARGLAGHMRVVHGLNQRGEHAAPTERERSRSDAELKRNCAEMAQMVHWAVGMGITMTGDQVCGNVWGASGNDPNVHAAWLEMAKRNSKFRKFCEGGAGLSVVGMLMRAYQRPVMMTLNHHTGGIRGRGAQLGGNPRVQREAPDAGSAYPRGPDGEPVSFDGAGAGAGVPE